MKTKRSHAGGMPALQLGKGRGAQRNRNVASVRVWKRRQRGDLFYCTIKLPGGKPLVRSCRHRIRASAEEFAQILLRRLMAPVRRHAPPRPETQLELPPPKRSR